MLILACFAFLLLQIISLSYSDNVGGTWSDIQRKIGLVLIPIAVVLSGPFEARSWTTLMYAYCISFLAASIYCLGVNLIHYSNGGDTSVFFYHKLVSPLHHHAVYFSVFVFIALIFLLNNIQQSQSTRDYLVSILMILFFSGLLFFLSSKLVISGYLLYLIIYLVSLAKRKIVPKKIILG